MPGHRPGRLYISNPKARDKPPPLFPQPLRQHPHGRLARFQLILKSAGYISLGIYLYLNYSSLHTGGLLLFGTALAGLLGAVFTIDENHRPFQANDYLHILIAAVHFFLLVTAMSAITTHLVIEGLLAQANLAHLFVTLAYDALFAFAICYLIPPLKRIVGLMERLFVTTTLVWLFLICYQLI
jgi:hypothetical protein